MVLKWTGNSNEKVNFNLFYKHECDENWQDVRCLQNVCKNDRTSEYRVEYTVPNAHQGKYICQMQSEFDFALSEKSKEKVVFKEKVVSL